MRKHITKLLTALLAIVMLLPVTAQAAPTDGWTDEVEQAYQTVTELVVQRVSESKDYLAAATQEENAKAVYALWTSGAAVPSGFYDEYLQALADWLDLAVKRGKTAYIPGAIRTVAVMGLGVTDFAGHDLMDALRKSELVEADEDRLDMLLDLDAAGDAGKTDEFSALREQLLTEALARQQSSGEFRYTSKWPAELKQKGVDDEPDRFDYILLTAKSAQALAPYQSRKDVSAAIDKALTYLSEQQLSSGGFVKYGDEDVEEDAAVLEMLAALGISFTDERFTEDGHTVLDGMMDWYQESYFDGAPAPGQGFYRHDILWGYRGSGDAWYASSSSLMSDPDAPDDRGKAVERRTYINEAGLIGLCSVRPAVAVAGTPSASTPEKGNRQDNAIDYSELLQAQSADYAQKLAEGYYGDGNSTIVSEGALSHLAKEILSMSEAGGGKLPEEQRAQLESLVEMLSGASGEYLMGRKANTYSPVLVQAMKALDMDPADINGMDFLAPLTNLSAMDTAEYREALMDFDSVDASMWRKRGVDADTVVDKYAAGILQYQTADGQFDPYASYSGIVTPILRDYVQYTAENVTALAPHADKEYISKAIDRAIEYLSSVQLSDGSFPGMTGTSNGEATLAVLEMMEALGISLDDPRFVKNGNTAADAMKTFYVDGVGFLSSFEVEAPLDDLGSLPVYADPVMDASAAVSALTYLQAAEDGTFGPDGKGSSVFEVVGAALTETPLGAILLAVIVVAILAFAMVRRYRRIKREQ
mgnify:CR=1 FL=1